MSALLSNSPYSGSSALSGGLSADFPSPWADYASLIMPSDIRTVLRWCLHPDTMIWTDRFRCKLIKDIRPGDKVITKGGTFAPVENVSQRQVDETLIFIHAAGRSNSLPLRVTGNHKIPCIRAPRSYKSYRVNPEDYKVMELPAEDIRVGDFLLSPVYSLPLEHRIPRFSGWLFGMYLSEGNTVKDGNRHMSCRFTLGAADEKLGILQKVIDESTESVGRHQKFYINPSRPDCRLVTVADVEMPDWMGEHGGHYADGKCISQQVLHYGEEFLLDMVAGWLDGDGCVVYDHQRNEFKNMLGITVSYDLAIQIQQVCYMFGIRPTISLCRRPVTTYGGRGYVYSLYFNKRDTLPFVKRMKKLEQFITTTNEELICQRDGKNDVIIQNGYVYRRVKNLSHESYVGKVYNLAVNGSDHSYTTDICTTQNCEFLMLSMGNYRQAVSRLLSYFITDVEISEGVDEIKDRWDDFLNKTLDIKNILYLVGLDTLTYGNSFTTVLPLFKRYLSCPRPGCGLEVPLEVAYNYQDFHFQWSEFTPKATCPKCHYTGIWSFNDRRSNADYGFRIKRWNPHEIEIIYDPLSDETAYIWRIPEDYKTQIRKGTLHHLLHANQEIITAIKNNDFLMFDKDVLYHMKEDTLAGIRNRGWGLSRVLSNFRQAFYVQVLHRYNEAIALDYIIPFRVITPAAGNPNTGTDYIMNQNLGFSMGMVHNMLHKRRRDPASWHTLPFPINYQAIGGDASKLAPKDLLEQGNDSLLSAIGIPIEMYRGSMTMQAAPVALRLFESSNSFIPHNFNGFLRFVVRQAAKLLNWEMVEATMQRTTHIDDVQRSLAKLQLSTQGQVSQTTGLGSVGINFRDEVKRIIDDQRFQSEEQAKAQESMESASVNLSMVKPPPGQQPQAQPGQPQQEQQPQPGQSADPNQMTQGQALNLPPRSPGDKLDPEELLSRAQAVAQQLLQMPATQRISEMRKLKQVDPTLHSIVKSLIEQYRQQARTQGGSQVLQQQFGGSGQ